MSFMHVPPPHGALLEQAVPALPPESNDAQPPGVMSPQSPAPPTEFVNLRVVLEQQLHPGTVVVVVVDAAVVVVVVGGAPPQVMAVKLPPPLEHGPPVQLAWLLTQLFWMDVWMPAAFPSPVHPLTLLNAVTYFPTAFEMHAASTGRAFVAAFEMQLSSPDASLPAAFNRDASHLLGVTSLPSGRSPRSVV